MTLIVCLRFQVANVGGGGHTDNNAQFVGNINKPGIVDKQALKVILYSRCLLKLRIEQKKGEGDV